MTARATDAPSPRDDDRAWLAFRYVAGELSTSEAAAFETRLDDDQEAREAVAEAVAVLMALEERARPAWVEPAPAGKRRRVAMISGLAATALIAVLPWLRSIPGPAGRGEVDPTVLAITWSGLWHPADAAEADAPLDSSALGGPIGERTDALLAWLDQPAPGASGAAEPGGDEAELGEPPLWMLEAASLGDPAATEGGPGA